MGKIYKAKNLNEALKFAKKLKNDGEYNLFRGQAKNWKVTSSAARLNKAQNEMGIEKLKRLYYFFQANKNLKKYTSNIDWFYAVAQHYGLPTNYIDFTMNYKVAAYFATNSSSNEVGIDASIICLNENDFNQFVDSTKAVYENDEVMAPYLSRVNVDNLWRLQSQEGLFLFSPYQNIEFIYDFDRIIFPFDSAYSDVKKSTIYPENKSELEIYLDYFFNREERLEGAERFQRFTKEMKIPVFNLEGIDHSIYMVKKENHMSWLSTNHNKWVYELSENWNSLTNEEELKLELPNEEECYSDFTREMVIQLDNHFKSLRISRNFKLKFKFNKTSQFEGKLLVQIERSCSRIWDGLRNLPFTSTEIFQILGQYVYFECYEHLNEKAFAINGSELVVLELANKHQSITRCYVSKNKLEKAFREDLAEVLIPEESKNITSEILLKINSPQLIFDFEKLLLLFKEEMIAYQVSYNSEKNNPVIYYSPTEISVLGYA